NVGNISEESTTVVKIDKVVPRAPVINGNIESGVWTTENVTLTISGSGAPSGITKYQYSTNGGTNWTDYNATNKIIVSGDGTTNVIARAVNSIGVTGTNTQPYIVKIDKAIPPAPTISGTVSSGAWTNGNVTLTIAGSSAISGIAKYQYSTNGGTNWTDYNATNKIVVSNQGITNVIARSINNLNVAGTESSAYVVKIDKSIPTAPTITGTVGNGVWSSNNVTLTISGSSAISGIAKYQYSTNGGTNWTDYNATNKLVISGEGTTNVIARAVTSLGITGTNSSTYIVKIDKTTPPAPTITGTVGNGLWTNGNVTLTVSGSNAISGIVKYQYSTNNGSNWTDYNSSSKLVISAAGTTNIIARAINSLGISGVNSGGYAVKIDTVDPTTTIAPNGGMYTIPTGANVATIKARLTAVDTGGSSLKTVQYAWSNVNSVAEPTSWVNYSAAGQDITKTDAVAGTYYLWTRVIDTAGNRAERIKTSNAYTVKANTDAATQITITPSTTFPTNQNVTATIAYGSALTEGRNVVITPGASGSVNSTISVTMTANGNIKAQATDAAGNRIIKTLDVTNIDKTDPTIKSAISGDMLYTDTTFNFGNNHIYMYNYNSSAGTVTHTRKSMNTPVGKYALEISTTGTAGPGHGGFTFSTQTAANKVFVTRIVAKIPEGKSIAWATNAYGTGGSSEWLTPRVGTGNWQEYVCKVTCGSSGTFNDTNYFYLTGGATATIQSPVIWQVAYATVIDTTNWGQTNSIVSTVEDNATGVVSYGVNQNNKTEPTYINSISSSWLGMSKDDVSSNGTYFVWAKDGVGNVSNKSVDVNYVDTTIPPAPTITGTVGSGAWTNQNVTLTISGSSAPSGIASYQYSINGGTNWINYNGATKLVISSDGTTNVIARAINTIGATGMNTAPYVVKIDKGIPPVPTISGTVGNGVWTDENVTLTISGSSASSGIVKYQYSINGGTWTDYNATNKIVISSQGITNVIARAVNSIGITGTNSAAYVVRIDKTRPPAPTISGTVGSGAWTNQNVTLTISGSSASSGIAKYQYSTNGGTNWTDYNATNKIVISSQGTTNVIARTINTIGVTGTNSATYVVRIDKSTPPAPTISGT
ncbi:MAG: hypothetical protein RSD14_00580, partial [Clostridia bacterium]